MCPLIPACYAEDSTCFGPTGLQVPINHGISACRMLGHDNLCESDLVCGEAAVSSCQAVYLSMYARLTYARAHVKKAAARVNIYVIYVTQKPTWPVPRLDLHMFNLLDLRKWAGSFLHRLPVWTGRSLRPPRFTHKSESYGFDAAALSCQHWFNSISNASTKTSWAKIA